MTKEEIEAVVAGMCAELKHNELLFAKIPHERLARLASELFGTVCRSAQFSPETVKILIITGVLQNANDMVKAYNNEQQLKVAS